MPNANEARHSCQKLGELQFDPLDLDFRRISLEFLLATRPPDAAWIGTELSGIAVGSGPFPWTPFPVRAHPESNGGL